MSRGPYSMLLMLAMSLPGAARALGLGDIRVDSGLNEPLSAQIDIVGASRDELVALTATVANREIFQRYGADRPAFLSSATFKVGMDAQGRPVLSIRSTEAFTDPVVSFLVDLRWGKNDVVREYSLLLDPPGLNTAHEAAMAAVASTAAPVVTITHDSSSVGQDSAPMQHAAPPPRSVHSARSRSQATIDRPLNDASVASTAHAADDSSASGRTHHRVSSGETLRGIARSAGARSEPQAQRMMLAIFRANPNAFEGNVNRLHNGALLTLPSADEWQAIPVIDAKREIRAQMTAWRLEGRQGVSHHAAALANATPASAMPAHAAPSVAQTAPAAPAAAPVSAPAVTAQVNGGAATAPTTVGPTTTADAGDAELNSRVKLLEKSLADVHQQLASESAKLQDMKEAAARAEVAPELAAPPAEVNASRPVLASFGPQSLTGKLLLVPLALGLGLLVAGFAYARRRFTAPTTPAPEINTEFHDSFPAEGSSAVPTEARMPATPVLAPEPAAASSSFMPTLPPADVAKSFVQSMPRIDAAAPVAKLRWPAPTPAVEPEVAAPEVTQSLEIDTELLERSYLESLGVESTEDDTSVIDTSHTDTSTIDASDLDTAVLKAEDLNTMILEGGFGGAEDLEIGSLEDTNKLANSSKIDTNAINKTQLDYNLLDLDATAQHVHMPSDLHDRPATAERRTNIVDVLKSAIERDPYRSDLRMKLLETYYSLAATNQRAFVDVVRKLAGQREFLTAEEWNKVKMMGREIAADEALFDDQGKDDARAHHAA